MSDPVRTMLDDQSYTLWHQYLASETQGLLPQALQGLDDFIRALRQVAPERRETFLAYACTLVVDKHQTFPLRQPLFVEVLAPYLIAQYHAQSPAAPRWIAGLADWFNATPAYCEQLGLEYISEHVMLREALIGDPSNMAVQRRLIEIMAGQNDYSIHEVPAGVLYDSNGASIAECQELLEALAEFRQLAQNTGLLPEYERRLGTWEFYFTAYADYLTNTQQYNDFADYLEHHAGV
jgi:hypothetical protein